MVVPCLTARIATCLLQGLCSRPKYPTALLWVDASGCYVALITDEAEVADVLCPWQRRAPVYEAEPTTDGVSDELSCDQRPCPTAPYRSDLAISNSIHNQSDVIDTSSPLPVTLQCVQKNTNPHRRYAVKSLHVYCIKYKKLSSRRETARRFVSLTILLSHSVT